MQIDCNFRLEKEDRHKTIHSERLCQRKPFDGNYPHSFNDLFLRVQEVDCQQSPAEVIQDCTCTVLKNSETIFCPSSFYKSMFLSMVCNCQNEGLGWKIQIENERKAFSNKNAILVFAPTFYVLRRN